MFPGFHSPLTLFDKNSKSVDSMYFYVPVDLTAQLLSFGFTDRTADDDRKPQKAEVFVAITDEPEQSRSHQQCGDSFFQNGRQPIIIDESPIMSPNCECWNLSACYPIRLLDIPGTYKLVLNDSTALSVVHIYLKFWPKAQMNHNSSLYFGR